MGTDSKDPDINMLLIYSNCELLSERLTAGSSRILMSCEEEPASTFTRRVSKPRRAAGDGGKTHGWYSRGHDRICTRVSGSRGRFWMGNKSQPSRWRPPVGGICVPIRDLRYLPEDRFPPASVGAAHRRAKLNQALI